ncbi:MAG: molybdopterin-synthase adenylyltransferase MoeB [Pseudomonadota bacterium]
MTALTDTQLERYARHIVLHDIGGVGQKKLLEAKVLVIGAGGIGAPALMYLAAAGVGTLGIVDDDTVSLSNLQRQVLYQTTDIGAEKVSRAKTALGHINPDSTVETHPLRLDLSNVETVLTGYDIVLDGCDNFDTRLIVGDMCHQLKIPLVSAAVGRFDGQLSVFASHLPDMPCYRCLVPHAPPQDGGTCADDGVIGALTGVLGSWAALEVIKLVTGAGAPLTGKLLLFDGLGGQTRTVNLRRDKSCKTCT